LKAFENSASQHAARTVSRFAARVSLASICLAMAIAALALPLASMQADAAESVDYIAEHMIEAQMDARYLALPDIPLAPEDRRLRADFAYFGASGGPLQSSAALIGVQQFRPIKTDWALGLGAFVDLIRFTGRTGEAVVAPIFASEFPVTVPFTAELTDISGDAVHAGLSISLARHPSERWAWQAGVALEYYDIGTFDVAFRAFSPESFDGALSYAASYDSITPFFSIRHRYLPHSARFVYASRAVVAWPQPRRGLSGRLSGPDFAVEGDSQSAGRGTHIPDGFAGVGFTVESVARGWSVDVGASLSLLLLEGELHKGIDPPLFVRLTLPIH
jgi:hypothetical protein